jgi:hypothetical protein
MDRLSCAKCSHYKYCNKPCIYLEAAINGHKSRVEPLISNIIGNRDISGRPYTDVLAEGIEDIRSRLEYITEINDPKLRAIGAMLAAGLKRDTICTLIRMSHRQLIRVINNNNQLSTIRRVKMSPNDI